MRRVAAALEDLGPVFASFGRYLATRLDLISRRDSAALATIADRAAAMPEADVRTVAGRYLGEPIERRFFAFDAHARIATLWMQRHDAWLAPGVPVHVRLVRPDAPVRLAADLPLLPELAPFVGVAPDALDTAIDDFSLTLRRRLDQTHQAAAFATLAADASSQGGFYAPIVYRDHTAPGILTIERPNGALLRDVVADVLGPNGAAVDPSALARRFAAAWLRETLAGRLVPFDFDETDVVLSDDRLVLVGGAFEPHTSSDRGRFLSYINAVAADDPEAAAAWIVDASSADGGDRREEELRRRLRQAVPFRDGEWSGDDRLAEQVLVQWRMAALAGWPLTPHHLHVYRGIYAVTTLAMQLAPDDDSLSAALQEERVNIGISEARHMVEPASIGATLDRLLQEMVHLPQKLDEVLTLAAEGRLRVRLNVPDGDDAQHRRNRTVLLVATLVALTALASVARHFAPALGSGAERLAAVAVLALGAWLLVVAARMS